METVFLDVETTGLTPGTDNVIQLAMVSHDGKKQEVETFNEWFKPEAEISQKATEIHGMTNESLRDCQSFAERAEEAQEFLQGKTIVIHNAEFDTGMLNAEFDKLDLPRLEDIAGEIICSLEMSRAKARHDKKHCKTHNLDALVAHSHISATKRGDHNALEDVKLLAQVYYNLKIEQTRLTEVAIKTVYGDHVAAKVLVREATSEEVLEHKKYIQSMEESTGVVSKYNAANNEEGKTPGVKQGM